jgi:prepilin-type N-terminal cleavage/methylation domain-containing protein
MTKHNTRAGFTLIELLVVMSLTAALGALTLGLLPGIVNKDNTLKATAEVQGALRIAQGHAASTKHPRGVRFLTNANGVATEMQYLEAPEVVVSDLQVLVQGRPAQPFVQFQYEYYNGSEPSVDPRVGGNPAAGAIKRRHCILSGLTGDQAAALGVGATLSIPTLGFWSQILSYPTGATSGEAVLDVYPDAYLGAAGPPANSSATGQQPIYRSYHFGIYGAPVPQLGEPTVPLPKDIAVDLTNSLPAGIPNVGYDVMFAPNGQTIGTRFTNGTQTVQVAANAGVYLWVRDVTKVPTLVRNNPQHFRTGGEQQIVGVRNGYVGTAPVEWPDNAGNYTAPRDAYQLARERLD